MQEALKDLISRLKTAMGYDGDVYINFGVIRKAIAITWGMVGGGYQITIDLRRVDLDEIVPVLVHEMSHVITQQGSHTFMGEDDYSFLDNVKKFGGYAGYQDLKKKGQAIYNHDEKVVINYLNGVTFN